MLHFSKITAQFSGQSIIVSLCYPLINSMCSFTKTSVIFPAKERFMCAYMRKITTENKYAV